MLNCSSGPAAWVRAGSDHLNDEDAAERPSKSARKRAAHAAQDLGEALIGLPDGELDALALPEELAAAVRAAAASPAAPAPRASASTSAS